MFHCYVVTGEITLTCLLDGSEFGIVGPAGSAEAEKLFQDYYDSVGSNWTSSEFNGRSDYGPFLDVGIASGGLDTGGCTLPR